MPSSTSLTMKLLTLFSFLFATCLCLQKLHPEKDIHFFYYIWYGTPDDDGSWKHWDHEVLPHWQPSVNKDYPTVGSQHSPPGVIHSPYYPFRNPYSSRNYDVIMQQFNDMVEAGGNVAVVSWWGQSSKAYSTDTQGVCTDKIIGEILQAAQDFGKIKIAFHLEPYVGRNVESVREDLMYISENYGHYSSLYRAPDGKPLYYVYDSYHIFPSQWRRLLQPDGDISIRGTPYDGWFIGLWLESHHGRDAKEAGFDGIYTYFATDGFTYGSTTSNWKSMCNYCNEEDLLCILSVGPGYNDTSIRPWNAKNIRDRRDGAYYEDMWERAIAANPTHVSITSFNEWGEGTQIEAARTVYPEERYEKTYLDYGERGPFKYLHITDRFSILLKGPRASHHDLHSQVEYLHDIEHGLSMETESSSEGVTAETEFEANTTDNKSNPEDGNEEVNAVVLADSPTHSDAGDEDIGNSVAAEAEGSDDNNDDSKSADVVGSDVGSVNSGEGKSHLRTGTAKQDTNHLSDL